jgi:hypothetical protein
VTVTKPACIVLGLAEFMVNHGVLGVKGGNVAVFQLFCAVPWSIERLVSCWAQLRGAPFQNDCYLSKRAHNRQEFISYMHLKNLQSRSIRRPAFASKLRVSDVASEAFSPP